jgi:hypothetical protein
VSSIGSEGLRKVEIVIWGCPFKRGPSTEVSYPNKAEGASEGFNVDSETSLVEPFEPWVMLVIVCCDMKVPDFKGSVKKSSSSPEGEFPDCKAEEREIWGGESRFSCAAAGFELDLEVAAAEDEAGGEDLGLDVR